MLCLSIGEIEYGSYLNIRIMERDVQYGDRKQNVGAVGTHGLNLMIEIAPGNDNKDSKSVTNICHQRLPMIKAAT